MKRPLKQAAALFLSLMLAVPPLASTASASAALGSELQFQNRALAPGVTATSQNFWSDTYSDVRTENYIEYTPSSGVSPVVSYGTYVTSRQSLTAMAKTLEAKGLRVVGGINAGFYNVNNGTPIGVVITDGLLRSANPDYYAIGFKADGTAIIGQPQITITATWNTAEGEKRTLTMSGFNKIRADGGYFLFSDSFAETTKNNVSGVDVILRPLEPAAGLPVSGSVPCEVVRLRDSKAENAMPPGCFVISINENSDQWRIDLLSTLQPGDTVTLNSTALGQWAEVTQAVSGLYSLVKNGQVQSGLSTSRNPYTAVGQRADGSVIFYTIDGRQSGYSIGATYAQVASRLIELGCVTAIALDGGGSTSFGTTYPGSDTFSMTNKSSDGAARSVSTCLFLTTAAKATGELGQFQLIPASSMVFRNSTTNLTFTGLDTNCYPMSWGTDWDSLTWNSTIDSQITQRSDGSLVYNAGSTAGTDVLSVQDANGISGETKIRVIDTLTSISIKNQQTGETLTSQTIQAGETFDFSVGGGMYRTVPVACSDNAFQWSCTGIMGTIDAGGRFTAIRNGSGTVSVSGGGLTVTIPVTVTGADPFTDTIGHWAQDFATQLYKLGITNGVVGEDGTVSFYPDRSITRGELLTMVVRMLKADPSAFAGEALPFADAAEIPAWLLPYIKTAYGMGLLQGNQVGNALYASVNDSVTREAAMTIMGRTLEYTLSADLSVYTDGAQVSEWAREHVETMVAAGVVSGAEGRLNPKGNILRGEVAKIMTQIAALPEPEQEETESVPEVSETPEPSAPSEAPAETPAETESSMSEEPAPSDVPEIGVTPLE